MSKLIKNWEELSKISPNDKYRIEVNKKYGRSAWILPLEETKETRENYFKHHVYLSTHTFYGHTYEYSTKILQEHGFDVEIDNWDKVGDTELEELNNRMPKEKVNEIIDNEEIKTDHFKTMGELLKHLKMWEIDDDYDAYYRFFCSRCAYEMAHKIDKLQKENTELKEEKEKLIKANDKLKSTKRVKAYKVYKENAELKEKIKEYEIRIVR